MKRIEIFEEGFYLTFFTDNDRAYISASSLTSPYKDNNAKMVLLPPCRNGNDISFVFRDLQDSGNQSGREVAFCFIGETAPVSAEVRFQFYRGERAVRMTVRYSDLNGLDLADNEPFGSIFGKYTDNTEYSVSEDGSELFRLPCDTNIHDSL